MTKTKLWSLLALVVGVFAMAVVAGCGSSDDTSSDGTASDGTVATADLPLLKPGTLTVGSDIPYPPFEQGDPPDYEGFDIDLINAIADKIGLETSIQDKPFNLLLSGGGGQIDMAIAATTITAERRRGRLHRSVLQRLSGPAGPVRLRHRDLDDLAGKIVGAQDGTTGETYANDNTDAAEVRPFPQTDDAYNALKTGQVDAVLNDLTAVQAAAKQLGGLEVVQDFPTDEQYGMYAQKGSPIIAALNEALQQVKDDGTLTDLYQQYFKIDPPDALLQPGPAAALGGGDTTTGG